VKLTIHFGTVLLSACTMLACDGTTTFTPLVAPSTLYVAVAIRQEPLAGAVVTAVGRGGSELEDTTSADGVVVFGPMDAGRWQVEIEMPEGYRVANETSNPASVDLKEGTAGFVYFNLTEAN